MGWCRALLGRRLRRFVAGGVRLSYHVGRRSETSGVVPGLGVLLSWLGRNCFGRSGGSGRWDGVDGLGNVHRPWFRRDRPERLPVNSRWRALGPSIYSNWSRAFGWWSGARVGVGGLRGPVVGGRTGCQVGIGPGIWGRLVLDPVVGEQLGLLVGAELVAEVDLGGVLDVALLIGNLEAVADLGRVDQGDEGLGGAEEAGVDQGPGGVAGLAVQVELLDRPDRRAVPVDDGERSPAVEGRQVEGRHGLPPCTRQSMPRGRAHPHCPPSRPA